MLPPNWPKLTPDEKLAARLAGFVGTEGKPFASPAVAAAYHARAQRYVDALKLKTPDRVPVSFLAGDVVADYGGVSQGDLFYDYPKAIRAYIKYHQDFELDYTAAGNFMPGPVYDRLGYKLYRWPGRSLPANQTFQYVEAEYMRADEYDAFIADPEMFMLRTYMPRIFGALESWQMLPTFFGGTELPFVPFMLPAIGLPPVQEAYKAWLEAGQLSLAWMAAQGEIGAFTLGQRGLPGTAGGFSKAPFDFIGDTLRGTRGVMLDLYRQPDKVLAACERMVPSAIQMAVGSANNTGNPFILIPLHKGADGFMSNKDFAKFYWPTLKALILGLIQEGVVPSMFVEGGYNQRLEVIAASGLPAGKTIWMFDKTDMAAAKKLFGPWACIAGNVPASLFKAGTPQQIEAYVKQLIDTCAPGGGFILNPGAVIDQATPENVHTFLKVGQTYGVSH